MRAAITTSFILAAALLSGVKPAMAGGITAIDLSQPFGSRLPWRFTATQGPDIPDPTGDTGAVAPGAIQLCISADGGQNCSPDLQHLLASSAEDDIFSQPHFLGDAEIVHPRDGTALLLLRVASLHGGNGDQRRASVALAYDKRRDSFVRVYQKQTGRNNNQEIRYMRDGPLKGAIISAEPTQNAPFGFWIAVSEFRPAQKYVQVLRYRSATQYGDGNVLAVIDSEMPGIQQRLGLWKPGAKLPLPAGECLNPRIIHQELWC